MIKSKVRLNEVPNKFIEYFSNIANDLVSQVAPGDRQASSYLKNRNINSNEEQQWR